ncbi:MAG: hypothetical protein ABIS20_01580 [Thermoanaerobaculia bacterium]
MKTWLRGNRWEVQPGKVLNRFPIRSDKFDENELILPLHLTAEGFPTAWGPAHAFTIRLNHSALRFEEKDAAYREQCQQAARDLLTLVIAQFLGLLRPDEIQLIGGEPSEPSPSRLFRLLQSNLESESRRMPALVVLRDSRLSGSPIAAINYPDCLWFPVHSYKLDVVRRRIEEMLGTIDIDRLIPTQQSEDEIRARVGQLRAYLRQFLAAGMDASAYARVLGRFEHGLSSIAEPGVVPIRTGRAFGLTGAGVQEIELRRSGDVRVPKEAGCPVDGCGHDWMNHRYAEEFILEGGSKPKRKIRCPRHGRDLDGWEDMMERSVFFDTEESEYIIWADDPGDEGGKDLQLPPNGERIELRSGTDGRGMARFRFNQAEVTVKGRIVKRSDVLLKRVVELPRGSAVNIKILPLNGEEDACVDWKAGGVTEDESRSGLWQIRLRGGWRPFTWPVETFIEPVISEPDNVTLLLWPGFADPKWTAETVVYSFSRGGRNPPKVRCYSTGPRTKRQLGEQVGLDIEHSVRHFEKQIDAMEFRSASNEPLGYFRPERRPLYPGTETDVILALDFGTSNTALCWKAPSDSAEPAPVAMDQDALPLELLAPVDPEQKEKIAESLSLPPFWPRLTFSRWCIPSELLLFTKTGQWTIPHDAIEPGQLENMDIRRDFKWQVKENGPRPIYLNMVLQMALANLRVKGVTHVRLRATYPLAFESGQLIDYDRVLQELSGRLASETGMVVTLSGYVNESISGLHAYGQESGILQCVIDFGGGTTDIAVRVLGPNKGFTEPLLVDSIRLAGNNVIDSLLADPILLGAVLEHGKVVLSAGSTQDTRQKVARQIVLGELRSSASGLPAWWRDLTSNPQQEQSEAAQRFAMRNRAFFDGILGYVLKLIAAAEQEMRKNGGLHEGQKAPVDIFLLGQGWGLLRLQVGRGDHTPQAYVKNRLEELRSALPFAPPDSQFSVYPTGVHERHAPKQATSRGASRLSNLKSAQELDGKTGRKTIFGFDVELTDGGRLAADEFIGGGRSKVQGTIKQSGAWDQFVGPLLNAPGATEHVRQLFGATDIDRKQFVESRATSLIREQIVPRLVGELQIETSPLVLLLEQIWAKQLQLKVGSQTSES